MTISKNPILIPIVEAVVITLITIYLLRVFADRTRTPWVCQAMTFVGWTFGFSMMLLIPLDIYTTITDG